MTDSARSAINSESYGTTKATSGYDLLGRRTRLKNPDTGEIRFDLDPAGNLVRKHDPNLDATQASIHYVYDFDQLAGIEYPDLTRNVSYTYGKKGTDPARNGVGRILEVKDDAGTEQRSYGKLGELTSTTRVLRAMPPYFREQTFTTAFTFDSFGRMMSIAYPDGETVKYTYDAGGLVESATGHRPGGTTVPGDEAYLASMAYDEFGQRVRMVLGNGVVSTYSYDPLTRRLASLATTTPLGRTLQAITYRYDRVGNVKSMVNALGEPVGGQSGAVSFQYGYDDLYRLTSASGEAKSRAHTIDRYTATYAYSDIHNMTSNVQVHEIVHGGDTPERPRKTNHAFAYDYDPVAPHRARKIGDTFLVYDGNGNTARECGDSAGDPSCGPLTDHLRTFAWSPENRLDSVTEGSGRNITRFVYDAGGDRVVKLGRGGEAITVGQFWSLKGRRAATKHVFAGATRLASKLLPPPGWTPTSPVTVIASAVAVVSASTVGTTSTSATNDNGCDPSDYQPQKCPVLPGGDPTINHHYDDTRVRPETYYYHQDHLGSTSWVTDQNAKVHEHVEYFPYGEVWRDPRSDADGGPVKGQRFLFTSKEMDEETGLYYFGTRFFDPGRVRWLAVDPALMTLLPAAQAYGDQELPGLGGVFNTRNLALYSYSFQNPVAFIDPDGNAPNQAGATSPSVISAELARYEATGLTPSQAMSELSENHGDNQDRYFYTDKYGWVDVRHFGRAAALGKDWGGNVAVEGLGVLNEAWQWLTEWGNKYRGGFSPEDIPSNAAGARFGKTLKDFVEMPDRGDGVPLSRQFDTWIKEVGGRDKTDPPANLRGLPLTDPSVRGGANRASSNASSAGPGAKRDELPAVEVVGP